MPIITQKEVMENEIQSYIKTLKIVFACVYTWE